MVLPGFLLLGQGAYARVVVMTESLLGLLLHRQPELTSAALPGLLVPSPKPLNQELNHDY